MSEKENNQNKNDIKKDSNESLSNNDKSPKMKLHKIINKIF